MSGSERRQLTLLFCDLVGSSELSERLDPEQLQDLFAGYRVVCRDAIGHYQGHLSQYLGDGVVSYFGYPIAHEDDAVRAVLAALRVVQELKSVSRETAARLGVELHVRAGLHTGLAVMGEVGPGGQDRLAVGEAVNLAARIQAAAEPDTVVLSGATAKLVQGHFELAGLGEKSLRGFTRPVELFRVLRSTGAHNRFEAAATHGGLTPYVGRSGELAEIIATWREVHAGGNRMLLVRGEAGIGKSRLIYQLEQIALRDGARVAKCFCSPLTQGTPLAPITEMLNGFVSAEAQGETSPAARTAALRRFLGPQASTDPDAVPLIAALLSLSEQAEPPSLDLSPIRRRARTLELLRGWIVSAASRAPFVLLVEDVHWADPSTLDFLDLIVREGMGARVLVCITARPEFAERWPRSRIGLLELGRLAAAEMESLVRHVAGEQDLPPILLKTVLQRSEGVPLFAEEVTKAVLESGALRLGSRGYELVGSFDERLLPATVQEFLVARLDRLGESKEIAQLGAAIGREFSYSLIRAVAAMGEARLLTHLEVLGRSELALVQGSPPDSTYRFKHALIQDTIYQTLLLSNRTKVHERIFQAMSSSFPQLISERPEVAAYHAERAGLRAAAVPLLRNAGVRALARTAVAEAVEHLEHGIELVDAVPEPERTTLELDLRSAIGPAYMATRGWAAPAVERSCARLRELAAARQDSRLYEAMWGLWTVHFLRGQLDPALEVARRVFEMAEASAIPLLQVTGHHALGYTHFYRGEYPHALEHAASALAAFDLERERQSARLFQFSSSIALWCYQAEALQVLGRDEEAAESLQRCRQLNADLRHAPSRAYSLAQFCFFFHAQGNAREVLELAAELRSLSLAEGFALWVPIAEVHMAWANACLGADPARAVEEIQRAKAQIDQSLTHITEVELTSIFAQTLLMAKRPAEVAPAIEAALRITLPGRLGHYAPELWRLQGEAALALGETERAQLLLRTAREEAAKTGATALLQRALASAGLGADLRT